MTQAPRRQLPQGQATGPRRALPDRTLVEPAPASRPARPRWRLGVLPLVVALVMLAGTALCLYPQAMAWISARDTAHTIDRYTTSLSQVTTQERSSQLAAAREYNARLLATGSSIADPWGTQAAGGAADQGSASGLATYRSMLRTDDTGVIGRLQVPAAGVDLPVYHGTESDVLLQGVGHVVGTSLPVGGPGTHAVLAGHSGLAKATMFTHLDRVRIGDTFTITVMGEALTYRVNDIRTVLPDDTQGLAPVAGPDLVTLVTCTPIGLNTHRLLVTGARVATPQAAVAAPASPPAVPHTPFPWWALIGAGVLAMTIGYVYWAGRPAGSPASGPRRAARARGI